MNNEINNKSLKIIMNKYYDKQQKKITVGCVHGEAVAVGSMPETHCNDEDGTYAISAQKEYILQQHKN